MKMVTMKEMLEAGVHFGHQKGRWNPRMRPFIWGAKNGIHVINLQRTARLYRKAAAFVEQLAMKGEPLLFVGTKRQAQDIVAEEATRAGQPYVNHRWLGGMLTNFRTIKSSIDKITEVEKHLAVGSVEHLTKKEVIRFERQRNKLMLTLGGIRELKKAPGALFVIDTVKEHLAVKEANRLGIPVIALVDTNSNPDLIAHPIPSNDDALRAIRLFSRAMADAYIAGAAAHKDSARREHGGHAAKNAPKADVIVRQPAPAAPSDPATAPAPQPTAGA